MLKGAVAKRYAQALFQVGKEKGLLDQFREDLAKVSQIVGDPAMAQVLDNPKVPFTAKREVVRRFLGAPSSYLLNFLDLLIARDRVSLVGQMREAYQRLLYDHQGIEVAKVTTAVPLDEGEKERLIQRLSEITGKKVLLELRVDPAILGGLVARMGDRVIDGSTTSRLKALRAELAGAS